MDDFTMKMLDRALSQVRSHGDARSLARMLLRLTEAPQDSDIFSNYVEEHILTLLIVCECKSTEHPTLANVYAALTGADLSVDLENEFLWKELVEHTTEIYRQYTVAALETRLMNLRLLQKIEATRYAQPDQALAS
jgi:hypothetical protein